MTRSSFRRALLGAFVVPLALAIGACGDNPEGAAELNGEPIEKIAPPEGQSWTEVVETTSEGGYLMGNPDAPIKLVEYASLTCPHCADFAAASHEELRETFVQSGRVSFEFRNFVMNPLDLTLAMLTRCGTPESFFALTQQVLANQHDIIERWSAAGEDAAMQALNQPPETRYIATAELADLTEFFAARGISADQARACLTDGSTAEALVEATSTQSEALGITGTPAFLINGSTTDINTWPEIKSRLESLGAR